MTTPLTFSDLQSETQESSCSDDRILYEIPLRNPGVFWALASGNYSVLLMRGWLSTKYLKEGEEILVICKNRELIRKVVEIRNYKDWDKLLRCERAFEPQLQSQFNSLKRISGRLRSPNFALIKMKMNLTKNPRFSVIKFEQRRE